MSGIKVHGCLIVSNNDQEQGLLQYGNEDSKMPRKGKQSHLETEMTRKNQSNVQNAPININSIYSQRPMMKAKAKRKAEKGLSCSSRPNSCSG